MKSELLKKRNSHLDLEKTPLRPLAPLEDDGDDEEPPWWEP